MIGIISIITLLIVPFILIILKGSSINKTEEEIRIEDEEQMKFLKKYNETHKNKNVKCANFKKVLLFLKF